MLQAVCVALLRLNSTINVQKLASLMYDDTVITLWPVDAVLPCARGNGARNSWWTHGPSYSWWLPLYGAGRVGLRRGLRLS